MPVARMSEADLAARRVALTDPLVLARYRTTITTVPGSECLWWTGAVGGRSDRENTDGGGHGRFWYGGGRVIIAHRFAYAVMHAGPARPADVPAPRRPRRPRLHPGSERQGGQGPQGRRSRVDRGGSRPTGRSSAGSDRVARSPMRR